MTCHRSLRKLVPGLEVVKSNVLLRPYCVLGTGHYALGTESDEIRLSGRTHHCHPVATLSRLCDHSAGIELHEEA